MAAALEVVEQEVEHESAARIVWALAWPAVALNSLQVVNNLLDTGFVGRLDASSMTAHGASVVVLFLMFSIVFALGTAATALVSRAYGANEMAEVRTANAQCLSFSALGGLLLTLIAAGLAIVVPPVLLPADDPHAMVLMTRFLLAYSLSLPALQIVQVLAGSLRGIGDTKSPMVISGLQILLHMTFNFLFIFPPHRVAGIAVPGMGWGLPGAGVAFTISAWVAALVYMAFGKRTLFGSLWRLVKPTWSWIVRIVRIAAPASVMGVLRVGALAAFMAVLKYVPDATQAIAAVRGGFTIESIMFMPGMGLSLAAATLVGQSLGMKRPDRAERLGWTAGHHAGAVIFALCVPIFLGADAIAGTLVIGKPLIAHEMATLIRFMCVTETLFGYSMVMNGAMQGAGDTVRPMWITVISLWLLRVPLAWLLALPLHMGASGAWLSMALTQGVAGLLGMWFFKQGAWKTYKV